MTTRECTCETIGHCAECRPHEIHPLRMTDDEFARWVADRKSTDHVETLRIVDARFAEIPIVMTHDHRAIWAAMTAPPGEPFPEQWIEPDTDPPRLTARASRLYVEALAANA